MPIACLLLVRFLFASKTNLSVVINADDLERHELFNLTEAESESGPVQVAVLELGRFQIKVRCARQPRRIFVCYCEPSLQEGPAKDEA